MVINLWYYRSWRWLKYYSISFFFARAVYKYYESPNAIKKYLYSPNAKSSNLYNCNNDNIMFAKAVQRAVTIHTAPTLSHPTVKLGFILYNTNCNYNNHRCIFSLYGIKKALRSFIHKDHPSLHIGIRYSLGGICSFFGDTIVSFFAITVHPPVVRQMDAFILKMTGGGGQFIDVGVT